MKQTMTVLVVLIAFCVARTYGQTSPASLSNLYVTITQAGDTTLEMEGVQYQNDSSAFANSVQLNALFSISNLGILDKVRLRYGSSQGASDILDMEMDVVLIEAQAYLMFQNFLYPIYNGRVHVRRLIPTSTFTGYGFLTVGGTDTSQRPLSPLVRNNIR